ncbi:MAG: LemA family protein, partial [Candidatus Omnitrophica bacterium]|nr:LemA family protein [Candidatus Omnitrophota bacterium]
MKGTIGLSLFICACIFSAVLGLVFVLNYNGLVVADKKVEAAQAQIETVCQRRLDLIPNLIETVRGYAAY